MSSCYPYQLSLVGLVLSGCRGSSAIVPSCLPGYFVSSKFFLVGISWVQNFFSWVFLESKFFSRGYFLGPNFFLVVFRRFKNFSGGCFLGSKIFSEGYFVGPKFFLVGILWVQIFFLVGILWVQNIFLVGMS